MKMAKQHVFWKHGKEHPYMPSVPHGSLLSILTATCTTHSPVLPSHPECDLLLAVVTSPQGVTGLTRLGY